MPGHEPLPFHSISCYQAAEQLRLMVKPWHKPNYSPMIPDVQESPGGLGKLYHTTSPAGLTSSECFILMILRCQPAELVPKVLT